MTLSGCSLDQDYEEDYYLTGKVGIELPSRFRFGLSSVTLTYILTPIAINSSITDGTVTVGDGEEFTLGDAFYRSFLSVMRPMS